MHTPRVCACGWVGGVGGEGAGGGPTAARPCCPARYNAPPPARRGAQTTWLRSLAAAHSLRLRGEPRALVGDARLWLRRTRARDFTGRAARARSLYLNRFYGHLLQSDMDLVTGMLGRRGWAQERRMGYEPFPFARNDSGAAGGASA